MGEIECPYCGQILPEGSGRPELKLHVETVHPCIKKGWWGKNLWPILEGEEEEDEVGEDGEEEGGTSNDDVDSSMDAEETAEGENRDR